MAAGVGVDPFGDFPALYEAEYGAVYRTVRGVVLDRTVAEDLAQDTFVKAYRARHTYRPTAPVGAWLHRIGVNLAISHLRREKLARLLPARLIHPQTGIEYEQAEARTLVEEALAKLSPRIRATVVLHYYHGLTRDEVAQVLGVPAGTVASRIAKAVVIMRSVLGVDVLSSDQSAAIVRRTSHGIA